MVNFRCNSNRNRRFFAILLCLCLSGSSGLTWAGNEEEADPETNRKPIGTPEARTVEVVFADEGRLTMVLDFAHLELESPYGKLSIPVEEIRRILPAPRVDEQTQEQIDKAIYDLGSTDFAVREAATKKLRELKVKAYPALLKASNHTDPEVARHARELIARLKDSVAAEKLEIREYDVVETPHSTVSGKLGVKTLQVLTTQFGKQSLKLADIRSLRSVLVESDKTDDLPVAPDPGNLTSLGSEIGKKFAFRVTGRVDGYVFGTGVYTTDSQLSTAAVHAGALKAGETGVVRVTIIASPPAFTSSLKNGVSSHPWGPYPAAYQVHVPRK